MSKFKGIITSAYINLQPINVNPRFLHYFLHTTDTNKVIYGLGSGLRQNISYLPPFTEQTRIATILSDMDAELDALVTQLAKAKQIKQGMMQKLLTGRIRLV